MKNLLLTPAFILIGFFCAQGQILLQEDFEAPSLPSGWSIQTNATDGGWKIGTPAVLSSQFFTIISNGSSRMAATNDDACNCDKGEDYLITPVLDFTGLTSVALQFDLFYGANTYQGVTERATVEVSLDGVNWVELGEELPGHSGWEAHSISLNAYAGENNVQIAFHYDDEGGWLYGFAVDNVTVEVTPDLDAKLTELKERAFGEENTPFPIGGQIFNTGGTTITSLEISYSIDGGPSISETFDNLNVESFGYYDFEISSPWLPDATGIFEVTAEITAVNGGIDENPDNNSSSFETEIFPKVTPLNLIDQFLLANPIFTGVATASDQLDKPTDLDFFPILAKDELWVVNQRTESAGGSTLTLYNASSETPEFLQRVDGNAWHFMSLPTGIAFSNNFNFSTSPGVQDANHNGGTFTGPTLWSSDPEIYAQPSGGNGSHLDMLHGSPFSMGIAHEADNAFWVFDSWNETIVRYDFREDHGPGNDDHADGIVRRYMEIEVKKDATVPSHLVLDKASGWLYVVDSGNDRVLRLDINSGNVVGNLPLPNEPLAEHSEMGNVDWEVIVQENLDRPCGIELIENRLLVGDYATGEIIVYDIDNNFQELGRIATGAPGLTGLKIGPDGSIWFTNRVQNTLTRMDAALNTDVSEAKALAAQVVISPNPTNGLIRVSIPESLSFSETTLVLSDLTGKRFMSYQSTGKAQELDLSALPDGMYLISIRSNDLIATRKLVLKK